MPSIHPRPFIVAVTLLCCLIALLVASHYTPPAVASIRGSRAPTGGIVEGTSLSTDVPTLVTTVIDEVTPSISAPLRDLPAADPAELQLNRELNPRQNRTTFLEGTVTLPDGEPDPLVANGQNEGITPLPSLTFDGITFAQGGTGSPPDTVGDVGPNHYFQSVNGSLRIWDKNGTPLTNVIANNALWSGTGGRCDIRNDGDPVVLYDGLANRWLFSQFVSASPYRICVAISTTPDPTGTYYLYEFTPGTELPDYFKFGVWPNGYYMSTNENTYNAYAFNRAAMLTGATAGFVKFTGGTNFYLPADVDGVTPPPANAPGIFYTFKDNAYASHGGGVDRIELWQLTPNFVTPASSTFVLAQSIPVTSFTYTVCGFFVLNCVPQSGTPRRLDALSEWPMFRLAYRNFTSHQSLVGNFGVDVGSDRAGIRWFELQRTGSGAGTWSLYQEGTYAPGSEHRFVGSIAQDHQGNIALGYSVSSSTMNPAIRYATRLATDPLGTLQTEQTLFAGTASQTSTHSRWGDYAAMSIDPSDECTFWFTSEYFATGSTTQWRTRIGKFKLAECTPLAVEMASFEATPNGDHITVAWETATETNNLGFNLWRGESIAGPTVQLNGELIPSTSPGGGQGAGYAWQDATVNTQSTYYYWLETVDLNGNTHRYGPISATLAPPTAITVEGLTATPTRENALLAVMVGSLAVVGLLVFTRRWYQQ